MSIWVFKTHICLGHTSTAGTSIGTDGLTIYNGFAFDNGDTRDIASILKKFDEQIIGELNETYERYTFNSRKQATGERFDVYLTYFRHLANCPCDTLRLSSDRGCSQSRKIGNKALKNRNKKEIIAENRNKIGTFF